MCRRQLEGPRCTAFHNVRSHAPVRFLRYFFEFAKFTCSATLLSCSCDHRGSQPTPNNASAVGKRCAPSSSDVADASACRARRVRMAVESSASVVATIQRAECCTRARTNAAAVQYALYTRLRSRLNHVCTHTTQRCNELCGAYTPSTTESQSLGCCTISSKCSTCRSALLAAAASSYCSSTLTTRTHSGHTLRRASH